MNINLTKADCERLVKKLYPLLPTKGRGAFANKTVTRLPSEKVNALRELVESIQSLIESPLTFSSVTLTVEEFSLVKRVVLDEDSKL